MTIQILGDFDYKPTSCGLKDTVVTFRRLSGNDELALRGGDDESFPVRRFLAAISGIRNPPTLEFPDGSKRLMAAADIPDTAELSDLYYELVVEYSARTSVSEDAIKKNASLSASPSQGAELDL